MNSPALAFHEGDRVYALRRPHFPQGTVAKLMEHGYVLVHWDGDVLETAHQSELAKVERADKSAR